MLAVGLVPTLLVSAIAYATISSELTHKTVDQLTSTASSQQQKINSLLQKRQEEATKLANQFDLQSALGAYLNHKASVSDIYTILLNKKVSTPDIQTIDLIGLDGTIITSTVTTNENKKAKTDDYFVPTGQESNIRVKEDARDGIDKLYITTKVSVNKNEAGYLNLIFRIDDIVAAIQDYTGLGTTGETVVAAKNNNNDISLFPLRFNTDAALKTNLNSLLLYVSTEAGYQQATDYRGHAVLVASRSVGFADWVIATKIDADEALAPIIILRNSLLAILAVMSMAIVAFSLYFTRFFTTPILRIAEISKSYGLGDFSRQVDLRRDDEIGQLGDSINTMGHNLHDYVANIESQRNRLQVILNSSADSIFAINKSGDIILANATTSTLMQLPINHIVGKPVNNIFTWHSDIDQITIDYNKPGTNIYTDLQCTDVAGATHYVKLIVAKLSGEQDAEAPQTIITIHDETKSRELENMKVDFVSMAAHELRTPLAATRGYLELISYKQGVRIAPDVKNYINQALKSTAELGGLIDNLLGVTRIERGTLTLQPHKVDLAANIQQAISNARFSATDKRLSLTYNGPTSHCYVIADQISLNEVINNLINNAIKYTNPGGSVEVTLTHRDQEYVIQFRDTGIGIPKSAVPNLFTKFYRVHGGLNSGSTGTGLGLFISKSIIERHGGTIKVESEEGRGSTFTITIPVFNEQRFAALHAQGEPSATNARGDRGWTTQNIAR